MKLLFKQDTYTAQFPKKGSVYAAGYDFYADLGIGNELDIFPGSFVLVPTGISMAIPDGYYMRIAPRSGLAFKHGIGVMAGVIDSDYRDSVGVILINHGPSKFTVKHGERIAQGIVTKIAEFEAENVGMDATLPSSARGLNGWGSTGMGAL